MTVWRTTREAEHAAYDLVSALGEPVLQLATHFAAGAVVVTAETSDGVTILASDGLPPEVASEAGRLVELHENRCGGRLFAFGGADVLTGVVEVGDILARTDIDEVVMVGHREPLPPEARLDSQAFVRPTMAGGRIELVVRPAAGGVVVPFEQPNPTPCCADHA